MDKKKDSIKSNSGKYTEERMVKELETQASVAKEILKRQVEEKMKKMFSNPSALALRAPVSETGEGLNRVRKTNRQLFNLYLTNQFVARAVNVRADTMIAKPYSIVGDDEVGVKACEDMINASGGINLFWQTSICADISGDAFHEPIYNMNGNKILRLKIVHPLTLSFKTDPQTDKIIVGPDKEPVGYVQTYLDENGVEQNKDIPKEAIRHFMFNTLGDEFTGLSLIQSGYDTIVRLMNMEYSAAEAAVKTANPLIVAECNTKSPHQVALWGQILGNITGKDQLFIPEGMKLSLLSPGQQNFSDYAGYFLDAVVACTGVPKGVLLGGTGSGGGNRAEEIVLTRHFYSSIRCNQKIMSDYFNSIFEEYAELAGFKAPKLEFEDVAEDAYVIADSAMKLYQAGIINVNEARQMIGLEILSDKELAIKNKDLATSAQDANLEAWHPESPGKPAGSQAGVKAEQKASPNSAVSPASE